MIQHGASLLCIAALQSCPSMALGQACTLEWSKSFASGDVQGVVRASAVFDVDGTGPLAPSLVIGGDFTTAGGVSAPRIAFWSGQDWASLGGPANGPSNRVYSIVVFDDDDAGPNPPALYIGGSFSTVGALVANGIAKWNGSSWATVGSGVQWNASSGTVRCLIVHDEDGPGPQPSCLFAAGNFTDAGGQSAKNIARWNGAVWSPLGSGAGDPNNDFVATMAVFDADGAGGTPGVLCVGGELSSAGGVPVSGVARWNGTAWSAAGPLLPTSRVEALGVFDEDGPGPLLPKLFVAAGVGNVLIQRLDPTGWTALSPGSIGTVRTMTVLDDDGPGPHGASLVCGGDFGGLGGTTSSHLARWDGTTWANVGLSPGFDGSIYTVSMYDVDGGGPQPARLAACGSYSTAGTASAGNVAILDPSNNWSVFGNGLSGNVNALAEYDRDGPTGNPAVLLVGGKFRQAGKIVANGIAQWNGAQFAPLGSGVTGGLGSPEVHAITVFDEDGAGPNPPVAVVAGNFTSAGGVPASRIAKWDGTSWGSFGAGFDNTVLCLAVFDEDGDGPLPPTLYAGGQFQFSGVTSAKYLAEWTGTQWVGIPSQFTSNVRAMAVYDEDGAGPLDPALFVAHSDSWYPPYLGRWSGGAWSEVGNSLSQLNQPVLTLAVIDPDQGGPSPSLLYAGGWFTQAGSLIVKQLASWNGQAWQSVGVGAQNGVATDPYSILAYDPDGPGPITQSLHVSGGLITAGPQAVSGVARFDGASWHSLGSGLGDPPGVNGYAMAVFDDSGGVRPPALYIGGSFSTSGGFSSGNLARWGCAAAAGCYANCDSSSAPPILNVNDFACFLNRYVSGEVWANCDGSTTAPVLNINDFSCFINRYAAGCP